MDRITRFAAEQDVSAAHVSGIGAFERASLGLYQLDRQTYHRIEVDVPTEVLALLGNLSVTDEGPRAHLHATLSHLDGSAQGGHLFEGRVGATLEVFIREEPGELHRSLDPSVGLPLLDL